MPTYGTVSVHCMSAFQGWLSAHGQLHTVFSFSIAGRNTQLKYKCITVQVKIILFCNGDSRLNIFCKDSDSFTTVYNYTREICQGKGGIICRGAGLTLNMYCKY